MREHEQSYRPPGGAATRRAAVALAQSTGVSSALSGAAGRARQRLRRLVDPAARAELDDLLTERLRGATGAEMAVVTLPTIGDRRRGARWRWPSGGNGASGADAEVGDAAAERGPRAAPGAACRITSRAPGTFGSRWGRGSRASSPTPPRARSASSCGPLLAQEDTARRSRPASARSPASSRAASASPIRRSPLARRRVGGGPGPPARSSARSAPAALLFFLIIGRASDGRGAGAAYIGGRPWIGGGFGAAASAAVVAAAAAAGSAASAVVADSAAVAPGDDSDA